MVFVSIYSKTSHAVLTYQRLTVSVFINAQFQHLLFLLIVMVIELVNHSIEYKRNLYKTVKHRSFVIPPLCSLQPCHSSSPTSSNMFRLCTLITCTHLYLISYLILHVILAYSLFHQCL